MTTSANYLTDDQLATELEAVAESELARHLSMAKDWYPHEYVPWSEGSDFDGPLGGRAWSEEEQRFDEAAPLRTP